MEVRLDLRKSIPESAQYYYGKAKKAERKILGLEKAIKETRESIGRIEEKIKSESEGCRTPEKKTDEKRRWYEKFRWFKSSDGFLVVGGKDATSNEVLIKKHTEKNDLIFHADIQGAPFFVVKNPEGVNVPERTLAEAANASASYSSAWKQGLGMVDVYYISPEQVSKTPESGEYLAKGAFVVRGKKSWFRKTELKVAVGFSLDEGRVLGGPVSAVEGRCGFVVVIQPGGMKPSEISKRVEGILRHKSGNQENISDAEIQRFIPGGKSRIIK